MFGVEKREKLFTKLRSDFVYVHKYIVAYMENHIFNRTKTWSFKSNLDVKHFSAYIELSDHYHAEFYFGIIATCWALWWFAINFMI